MKKILVLYYSMYGHIEQMAEAVAEGARRVPGVEVSLKRVPETMPEDIARNAVDHAKRHHYDVLIVDTAGRLGIDEAMIRGQQYGAIDRRQPLHQVAEPFIEPPELGHRLGRPAAVAVTDRVEARVIAMDVAALWQQAMYFVVDRLRELGQAAIRPDACPAAVAP